MEKKQSAYMLNLDRDKNGNGKIKAYCFAIQKTDFINFCWKNDAFYSENSNLDNQTHNCPKQSFWKKEDI